MPDESTNGVAELKAARDLIDKAIAKANAVTTPPVVTPPAPSNVVTAYSLGIRPDTGEDVTGKLQDALNRLVAGQTLMLQDGKYNTSRELIMKAPGTELRGTGMSTIVGRTPERMAIIVKAANIKLTMLNIAGTGSARRAEWEACGIAVIDVSGAIITSCNIDNASAASIHMEAAKNFIVSGCKITNSRSDSIHTTGGSTDGLVELNTITNSGDDCLAVISYNGQFCKRILVRSNTVVSGNARGCSAVGSEDVTFDSNVINKTGAAGIYIASEPSYNSEAPKRIKVLNNTLLGCNTKRELNHGGIFLWSGKSDRPVEDVLIRNNVIRDTIAGGAHIVLQTPPLYKIRIENNKTYGSKQPFYIEAAEKQYRMSGNSHNDQPVPSAGALVVL